MIKMISFKKGCDSLDRRDGKSQIEFSNEGRDYNIIRSSRYEKRRNDGCHWNYGCWMEEMLSLEHLYHFYFVEIKHYKFEWVIWTSLEVRNISVIFIHFLFGCQSDSQCLESKKRWTKRKKALTQIGHSEHLVVTCFVTLDFFCFLFFVSKCTKEL